MPRINWRTTYEKAVNVVPNVWYRSPLWDDDHLLGEAREFREEGIAWCGRALTAALEYGEKDDELGGLYVSERKTGKCSQCRSRQEEWKARNG